MFESQKADQMLSPFIKAGRNRHIVLGVGLIVLALLTAIISFVILLGFTLIEPDRSVITVLISTNLFVIVCLILVIIREVYPVIKAHRARRAASRLHARIISLFSIVATIPALALAIVASVTLNLGLDRWFDTNTTQIVNSSIDIANAYADETLQTLRNSTYAMALPLDNRRLLSLNPNEYRRQMSLQAAGRNLRGAFLLNSAGDVLMTTDLGNESSLPIPPADLVVKARDDRPFFFQPGHYDYFGVIIKLSEIANTYLYVVRDVNKNVLDALRLTESNTNRYKDLEDTRVLTQIAFAVLYLCLFVILLLSAIWTAIAVANRLVRPIRLLISAADDVALGNMDVRVPVRSKDGDVGQLGRTFNYMVQELKSQRNELIGVRDQIDERRRFTEAVLSGVTAGVIGVDSHGDITIINRSAQTMFNVALEDIVGKHLGVLNPELNQVFEVARSSEKVNHREQLLIRQQGRSRVYNVQITVEDTTDESHSWVITIDDITDLVEAQRSSAWADVARRIAHEIKNPLTPIQLSAERIRRRYGKVVVEDNSVFNQCIDTIIRQVGDIGHMVDEFSSFARMPKPNLRELDMREPVREASFLSEVSRHDIHFEKRLSDEALWGMFDRRLIGQAFGNVIKNATESIDGVELEAKQKGHILIQLRQENDKLIAEFIDNGKGLPVQERQNLLEPYVTTREKGTGLGLAIVRKIVEEHGGYMELNDAPADFYNGRGAMIRMVFPAIGKDKRPELTQSGVDG